MIRILELFGGIGACSKALERLGIEYEIADYVEIDKYAVASYNAMHDTNFEPQDICKWDKNIEVDLIMHGSPCQDFSLAGLQAGGDEGSGTRSSLMYETIRIVNKLKPKYVIWENVKNMISKKHIHNFYNYIERMDELGYTSYYQVLNAKDYGNIPQNRERVFTISIRKDLNQSFIFPPKQKLKLKLKDMLEDKVEEKYYLKKTLNIKETKNYLQWSNSGKMQNSQAERAYYLDNDCMCTISHCNSNGDKTQIVEVEGNMLRGGKQVNETIEKNIDKFKEGKILNMDLYNRTVNEELSQTLTNPNHNSQRLFDGLRIRKLTPKECWRLMGFDDIDFEKASKVNSNTQLYKQAGNSIVVNVLEAILYNLLVEPSSKEENIIERQMSIYDFINEYGEF